MTVPNGACTSLQEENSSVDVPLELRNNNNKDVTLRRKFSNNFLRQSSLIRYISNGRRSKSVTSETSERSSGIDVQDNISTDGSATNAIDSRSFVGYKYRKGWSTVVSVVLVQAKGLPQQNDDGTSHGVYCKIRLGNESVKSKLVPCCKQPSWGERFKLHLYNKTLMEVTLWDKGKQKNFMGSCTVDLATLDRERTHELWRQLDDGFGSVHLSVTMCTIRDAPATPTDAGNGLEEGKDKYAWYTFDQEWNRVGELRVRVLGARGLSGKPSAYCTLELDNERVQTPPCKSGSEPMWDKCYTFNIHDVTSTLDIKVHDNSLVNIFQGEFLGKVSIPLLRVHDGELRWYALKDRSKRSSARGNCPRVLLEISVLWNPVKAALRTFRPKEVKHIKKPPKFDLSLIYSNIQFVRDTFDVLVAVNEGFKRLFEWENKELSFVAVVLWLHFWFFFEVWMAPLLLLTPFIFFWIFKKNADDLPNTLLIEELKHDPNNNNEKRDEKSLTNHIQGIPEMTLVITNGIEFIASLAERVYNLASFKVPFLSYVAMLGLCGASLVLYTIPFNYLFMAFGAYKFLRKYLNPERVLNNDILDFISHVPDNEILKEWKELSVPEPNPTYQQKKNT